MHGQTILGWLEMRMVNGAGPYLYYRYREPGSRTLHTEYYGRADRALENLMLLPVVALESPTDTSGETGETP